MYDFITHTGNAIKGKCEYDCAYCYMKRWGKLNPPRLDESELREPLPDGNFIWVGSSIDMFAPSIDPVWIGWVLNYCINSYNKFFWQSKNPQEFHNWCFPDDSVFCTTIETNRHYRKYMGNAPKPDARAFAMNALKNYKRYVTIEPIIDFDTDELFELVMMCEPDQVNIGADSGRNGLPEPTAEKVMMLIEMLKGHTIIHRKNNLERLLKE